MALIVAQAMRKSYSNLPTTVGSGGVLTAEPLRPAGAPPRPAMMDVMLAGSIMMPFVVFGTGTGSAAMDEIYTVPLTTGAWVPIAYHHGSVGAPHEANAIWQQHLMSIKNDFQITTSDLARFLLVERPSVYQWFADTVPRQRNMSRIRNLAEFAHDWASLGLGSIRTHLATRSADLVHSLDELLVRVEPQE